MNPKKLFPVFTIDLVASLKTIIMFLVFLGSGGVAGIFNAMAINVIALLFVVTLMWVNRAYLMHVKLLVVTMSVIGIGLFNMVLTRSPFSEYIGIFGRVITVALLITAFRNDYKDIAKYLVKVLQLIVVLATINFLLYMLVPGIFVMLKSQSGFPVNTIGLIFNYYSKLSINGWVIPRNQGIFWEPGVLQIPVNMLIYYRLIEENRSIKSIFLPVFILFTTFSTTGFIIFAIILFFKFKSTFSLRGKGLLRTLGMIVIISMFIPLLYMEVNAKFNEPGKNISSLARTYDLLMAARIATQYPWFGIGLNEERNTALMKMQNVQVDGLETETRGNTNSILQFFVNWGVPVSLILIFALYKQQIFPHRFCFFILIMLAFFSEPLVGVFLMILLMLSSIKLPIASKAVRSS